MLKNNKKKTILFLANTSSPHTQKWVMHFVEKGYSLKVLSFSDVKIEGAEVYVLKEMPVWKTGYLTASFQVRKLVAQIKPDIVHAHYASGYGLLGAVLNFHPYIISAWGSDVYNFPRKSVVHRKILQYSLSKADYICSTSHIMVGEIKKYVNGKKIVVTPFGVDCEKFKPSGIAKNPSEIVIGTVKSLEEAYGIEYLIKAFHVLVKKHVNKNLKLLIIGDGPLKLKLENLTKKLLINNLTSFIGNVPNDLVPVYLNKLSIYVSVSNFESFGVAAIEASSCGVPVVVSNVGGLPEIVKNNVTGFIVPPRSGEETAKAVERLITDPGLRDIMGIAGRKFVLENYEWNKTAISMEQLYEKVIN